MPPTPALAPAEGLDPEHVVAAALAAFRAQRWHELVSLTDTESLVQFRDMFVERETGKAARWRPTADDLQLWAPEKPRAVVEWEALLIERQWAACEDHSARLAAVRCDDDLRALGPAEFLVCWAQARHPEYQAAEFFHRNGLEVPPEITARCYEWYDRTIVGSLRETDTRALVLVRIAALPDDGVTAHQGSYDILPLRRHPGGPWRLLMTADWLGLSHTTALAHDPGEPVPA